MSQINHSTVSLSDDEVKVQLGNPNRFNVDLNAAQDNRSINSTPSKISKFTYNGD